MATSAGSPRRRLSRARRTPFAISLGLLAFALAGAAAADQTTGRIFGRTTDETSGAALPGLTVVAQGPQGEEATLTDESGDYAFAALPVGTYVLTIYAPGATPIERPNVIVSAERAVRVNLRVPRVTTGTETFVIERRAPMVDLGAARSGATLKREDLLNVPVGTSYGEALDRTPGAFVDRSGSVSIAGASGLENLYLVDGLNVTGIEFGDLLGRRANSSGGSNLPLAFVEELSISSGGYAAEFGGAMGGVVNVVTKSGSNEFHGSAYARLGPSFLQGDPRKVRRAGSALVGGVTPGDDWDLALEVGGPILKNRLFFWLGFAPQRQGDAFFRDVEARTDANADGVADLDADGNPKANLVAHSEIDQTHTSYPVGAKLTFVPRPEHRLNLSLFTTASLSISAFDRTGGDAPAAADLRWAMQRIRKNNTDVSLSWTGHFFDRRWRLESQLGLHDERYKDRSPYAELNHRNQIEWNGASLADLEAIAACQPVARDAGTWDPCPLDVYKTGGYGATRSYAAQRWVAELKSTHLFSAFGAHELKYGAHLELSVLDQTRHFSGPEGARGLVQHYPGNTSVWSFFTLPPGRYPFEFADQAPGDLDPRGDGSPAQLGQPPFYRDQLQARVKNLRPALFLQDSFAIRPNLTVVLGGRYENQRLYDSRGQPFASLHDFAFRGGAIYDFTNEGRSKLFGHYGRFYEAIPLNVAVRYFGGEGILIRNHDQSGCATAPRTWTGEGEWRGCPPQPAGAYNIFNNGSNYPVQPHLQGQHHDEIVGGFHYEVADGLLVGLEYTRRWLGAVIEDGTAADGTFVLANPGRVPEQSLRAAEAEVATKQAAASAAAPGERAARETELGAAQSVLANLRGLAEAPAPERTYDAVTLSINQRIGKRVSLSGWYTYSRLWGNYNGLHDADNNYFAPNGGNAYDTPDLVLNKRGPLANDRPHATRISGHYDQPLGDGGLVAGLSFAAFSGVPRNHVAALFPGQQLVFLLPRGSAGRTPMVTQLDARIAYRHKVSRLATLELSLELFNLLNRRTALRQDDNYTRDSAAAIVGGNVADLPHAKSASGAPITPDANFGRDTAYQPPFHGRLGLRALF